MQDSEPINVIGSFMASMCSYFSSSTKETLQEDEEFVNRKRTNEDDRELYGSKLFNQNLLVQVSSLFPTETSKKEHGFCYGVIRKVNNIKEARASDMVHYATSSMPKVESTTIQKTGARFDTTAGMQQPVWENGNYA